MSPSTSEALNYDILIREQLETTSLRTSYIVSLKNASKMILSRIKKSIEHTLESTSRLGGSDISRTNVCHYGASSGI